MSGATCYIKLGLQVRPRAEASRFLTEAPRPPFLSGAWSSCSQELTGQISSYANRNSIRTPALTFRTIFGGGGLTVSAMAISLTSDCSRLSAFALRSTEKSSQLIRRPSTQPVADNKQSMRCSSVREPMVRNSINVAKGEKVRLRRFVNARRGVRISSSGGIEGGEFFRRL